MENKEARAINLPQIIYCHTTTTYGAGYLPKRILLATFLLFLIGFLILEPSYQSADPEWTPPVTYLDDGFESGNFSLWNGTRVSPGEKVGVSSYRSLFGAYGGRATSNGRRGVEYAYCYKKLSCSELYVRGSFYVAKSGIVAEGDHFYLMAFQAGANTLAGVGWRKVGGVLRWFLFIRDGTSSIINYSVESPALNRYYSVELYWKEDSVNGEGRLWVSTSWSFWFPENSEICSITGRNTTNYGDVSEVQVGLPTVSYCIGTKVYFDKVMMADYFMETPWGIGFWQDLLNDDFETGSLGRWSGTKVYNGGKAKVTHASPYSGQYCGRFTSGFMTRKSGLAYCYKNIHLPDNIIGQSVLVRFDGYFKVSDCNIPGNSGRFYLFRAWNGNVEIIGAGWEKIDGVYRWFLSRKDGATTVTTYSQSEPLLNTWYSMRVGWYPFEYSWGATGCELQIVNPDGSLNEVIRKEGVNEIVYRTIDRVYVGLAKTVNCHHVTVCCDDFEFMSWQWE